MIFPHGDTVVRQRATTTTDRYGNTTEDWSNPTEVQIKGCAVYAGATSEPLMDARVPVDSDFTVLAPPGSDVTSSDRLVVRGLACDVNGRPFEWRSPFSGEDFGLAVGVKIREG